MGSRKKSDAYAEATVLQAAMERLAATDPVVMERGLGSKRVNAAIARIVVQTLRSGMPEETAAEAVPAPRARKPRITKAKAAAPAPEVAAEG
ncbi:hypothetical protein D9M68_833440 [compost metagenome]